MNETQKLVNQIVSACQEKKAKNIVTVDLTELPGAICKYFVICDGNTPNQIASIVEEIEVSVKKTLNDRPISINGIREAKWVGIDYGTVIVHVFIPELREFYDLEHLWADAKLEQIPDLD